MPPGLATCGRLGACAGTGARLWLWRSLRRVIFAEQADGGDLLWEDVLDQESCLEWSRSKGERRQGTNAMCARM